MRSIVQSDWSGRLQCLRQGLHGNRPSTATAAAAASSVSCREVGAARSPELCKARESDAGTTSSPAAVSAPWATSRRHVKSWFGATPCRRATKLTVMPGSNVSSTIRTAPTALNRCGDLNSIRRIGHRHGCMPHTCQVGTVSGRFRGLSHASLQSLALRQRYAQASTVRRQAHKLEADQLPTWKFREAS